MKVSKELLIFCLYTWMMGGSVCAEEEYYDALLDWGCNPSERECRSALLELKKQVLDSLFALGPIEEGRCAPSIKSNVFSDYCKIRSVVEKPTSSNNLIFCGTTEFRMGFEAREDEPVHLMGSVRGQLKWETKERQEASRAMDFSGIQPNASEENLRVNHTGYLSVDTEDPRFKSTQYHLSTSYYFTRDEFCGFENEPEGAVANIMSMMLLIFSVLTSILVSFRRV